MSIRDKNLSLIEVDGPAAGGDEYGVKLRGCLFLAGTRGDLLLISDLTV